MKLRYLFSTLLLLSSGTIIASLQNSHIEKNFKNNFLCQGCFNPNWCQIGNRGFSTMNSADWYEILTFSYPITTPLSINPTYGSTQGNVQLTPTGIRLGQAGNYFVSMQAIVLNTDPEYTPLIPIFLVRNGVFEPGDTTNLAAVGNLPAGEVADLSSSGVLENVEAGTTLSIVATNGGSPQPAPITVISWSISAFKIPCNTP